MSTGSETQSCEKNEYRSRPRNIHGCLALEVKANALLSIKQCKGGQQTVAGDLECASDRGRQREDKKD